MSGLPAAARGRERAGAVGVLQALTADEARRAGVPPVDVDDVVGVLIEAHLSDPREALVAHDLLGTKVDRALEELRRDLTNPNRPVEPIVRRQDIGVPPAPHLLALVVVVAAEHRFAVGVAEDERAATAAVSELHPEGGRQHPVDPLERARAQRQLLGRLVHHLRLRRDDALDHPIDEGEHGQRVGDQLQPLGDAALDAGELLPQEAGDELDGDEHLEEARSGDERSDALDHLRSDLGVLAPEDLDVLGQEAAPDGAVGHTALVSHDGVVGLVGGGQADDVYGLVHDDLTRAVREGFPKLMQYINASHLHLSSSCELFACVIV